ncbi:MAG: type II secretion system F family protein [Solirubrobacteraceae bacterium]
MTRAALLAGLAGMVAVAAAWETVAAIEQAAPARTLARLLAALATDRPPTAPERRRLALVAAATAFAAGWLLGGPALGVACAAGGPFALRAAVRARRARRHAQLAAAAPAVARALADALAGGHGVRGAIAAAATAGTGAARPELGAAARALSLGAGTGQVLESLRARAADPGWDAIVAAVLLARDHGGDLARLLRETAVGLEDAARLRADARSATAQARFTAWVVGLLPAGAAALGALAAPGSLAAMLGSRLSAVLLMGAAGCQVGAAVLIRRICRLGEEAGGA